MFDEPTHFVDDFILKMEAGEQATSDVAGSGIVVVKTDAFLHGKSFGFAAARSKSRLAFSFSG